MIVSPRAPDELQGAPALATLPALSACIDAFVSALDVAHPSLVVRDPVSERESAALLLHMHLHTCQELLRLYDHLTFDVWWFSGSKDDEADVEAGDDPDDDIPF
jgi:hypothetical protein